MSNFKNLLFDDLVLNLIFSFQQGLPYKDWVNGDIAAKCNFLYLIKTQKNMVFTKSAIDWAAQKGNFEIVQYLFNQKYKFSSRALSWAAENGHLKILQYLFATNFILNYEVRAVSINIISKKGYIYIFVWLQEMKLFTLKDNESIISAVKAGNLEMLKFLFECMPKYTTREFPINKVTTLAAQYNFTHILTWLNCNKIFANSEVGPFTANILSKILKNNNLHIVKLICDKYQNNCKENLSQIKQINNKSYKYFTETLNKN